MPSSHSRTAHDQSTTGHESATAPVARAPGTIWGPAHLGELTGHLPAELVDEALDAAGTCERRIRLLPSRVIVYFVVALALFPELGYKTVFAKLCLGTGVLATVTASALAQARRRIGIAPLRWIFEVLRGAAPTITGEGAWFGALRICALDGTILTLPDTPQILTKYTKQAGYHGGTGYPQARVVALIACGTRSIMDAVFGPSSVGETTYTPALLPSMGPGMIILADRNFAAAALLHQISATGAHYLVRVKNPRHLPIHRMLEDGSYLSVLAGRKIRVITATITLHTTDGQRTDTYRLVTTVTDPRQGTARDLMRLYHERWEIETTFREIKSTMLGGRVLRSRTVALIEQEIYALLIAEQLLRTAMSEATNAVPDLDPDRASFTIALTTARDTIILGPATRARPGQGWHALAGRIGEHLLANLLPPRRLRTGPRTVKRAISKYQARATKPHGPTQTARLTIQVIAPATGLTTEPTA
ncbi:MAG: IS4 family transposase [Cellulosimicrobium cellulans]